MSRARLIEATLADAMGDADMVVLHSALYRFGMHPDGLRDDMFSALQGLVGRGKTIALPAFTFSFCRTGWFHHCETPSETGILSEWAATMPEAARTPHPVYSFVVLGPRKDELLRCRGDEAFGAGTVFEVFDDSDARIVMAGATWASCTQVHRYEELAAVPYRERLHFPGTADFGSGPVDVRPRLFVRDVRLGSELNYWPAFDRMRAQGQIAVSRLGRGPVEALGCSDLARVCTGLLRDDPFALVHEPREIERRLHAVRERPELSFA